MTRSFARNYCLENVPGGGADGQGVGDCCVCDGQGDALCCGWLGAGQGPACCCAAAGCAFGCSSDFASTFGFGFACTTCLRGFGFGLLSAGSAVAIFV